MEHFNKLYISDIDNVSKTVAKTMVMCGSSNWDHYFLESENNDDEVLEHVTLLEFDNKKEMEHFLASNDDVIDFSLEHQNPSVLIQG